MTSGGRATCLRELATTISVQHQPFLSSLKVFGSQAFEPDSEYNRHNHFQTFMAGLLVLFR